MTETMVKRPFSTAGVDLWQQWLEGLSPIERNEEANLVERGLYSYVPLRFALTAEQIAFLDSLPEATCALWASQIAYAIRQEIAITLTKPEQKTALTHEGSKFIEADGRTGAGSGDTQGFEDKEETTFFLNFTISY
ncbi:hypothetical protein SAMN05216436_115131 [bacterium A37T11]|nr:hypothetical protein SAMN05216436_115131 [bacterium A37T11]